MKKRMQHKYMVIFIIVLFVLSNCLNVFGMQIAIKSNNNDEKTCVLDTTNSNIKYIKQEFSFSYPEIVEYNDYCVIRVKETNHNRVVILNDDPGKPVLPVNISVFKIPFGSKIIDVDFEYSDPIEIPLPSKIACAKYQTDTLEYSNLNTKIVQADYKSLNPYPENYILFHTGGGLDEGFHTTFFVLRAYPVIYYGAEYLVKYVEKISVNISYMEPEEEIIPVNRVYDLLIICPTNFKKHLEPLACFKEHNGIKTKIVTTDEIYETIYFEGRDPQEKIKYFIKNSIEGWNIKYVLLVGGIIGQGLKWSIPVRYSHVVPPEEQEYPEQRFVSDLYYADIYDSEGRFCSWDSNGNDRFAEWNNEVKDNMDVYPDVYLGRLACRDIVEVKILVNKILNYEGTKVGDKNWFNNLLIVAGDSYVESNSYNEGVLAGEEAVRVMPGFNPLRVYSIDDDISRETVNKKFNKGAGFAYFCGHGSMTSWNTHFFPANNTNWCDGYDVDDMVFLRNKEKLPITVVGGCHNAEFNSSIIYRIRKGIQKNGLKYLTGRFLYDGWVPNCWAWWLTSKYNGGSIACIANTGLGTHGDGDQDNNSVVDYLEFLDGWLEIRFLELYGTYYKDILGQNYGQTLTEYLHRFLGDESKMDVKMVQQWQLFGDPSLKIGGY